MRRRPTYRPGVPMLVLLLALLTHAALGPILACHTADGPRPAVASAAAAPDSGLGGCPGCLNENGSGETRQAPGPAAWDGCTSDHPCQHLPSDRHGVGDVTVRASETSRVDAATVVLPWCPAPERPEPPAVPVSASGPVPLPAEREPVAVLCVDRN